METWAIILIIFGVLLVLVGVPLIIYFTVIRKSSSGGGDSPPKKPPKTPKTPKTPSVGKKFVLRPASNPSLKVTTFNPQSSPGNYTPWLVVSDSLTRPCSWITWENKDFETPYQKKIKSALIFDGNLPQFENSYLSFMQSIRIGPYDQYVSLAQSTDALIGLSYIYEPSDKTWCITDIQGARFCLYFSGTPEDPLRVQPFDPDHLTNFQWINDPTGINPPGCL